MADAIMEGLLEYADMATEDMKVDVKKAAKTVKKDIQAGAPVKSGAYSKSWAVNPISPLRSSTALNSWNKTLRGLCVDKILESLAEIGIPYAYDHFAEGESPDHPSFAICCRGQITS